MTKKRERANGDADVYARKNKEGKIIGYRGSYWAQTLEGPKRRYVSGKNKGETRAALAKAKAETGSAPVLDSKAQSITLGEWLDRWISDCLKPLVSAGKMAHSTFVRYEGIVDKHLKPALGNRKLKALTRPQVRNLYAQKGETLSPRSVDYIHVTLQKALSQAVRDDLIPRNVAEGERPRSSRQREEAKALSPAQVRALLEAARGQRNESIYIVAVHTGLRQGELLGLRWTDVDLDSDSPKLSVRRSLKVTPAGLGFGPPKNKASRRQLPLNRAAVAALRAHRTRQSAERLASPEWRDGGLIFPNRIGGPLDHNNLYYREYKPLLKRAGLEAEGFTFHALRHTFASALLDRDAHMKKVQTLMGHSSITQTIDTYSHLMRDIGGDVVDGLEEAFG